MTFFYMTMRVIGELFLCSFTWVVILFCFITAFCFLGFWKDFFCEYLEKKKEEKLMYLSIYQFFTLEGYELDDDTADTLTQRATELSQKANMYIKNNKYFHKNILKTIFDEWKQA